MLIPVPILVALRIIWARKLLVGLVLFASLTGAYYVIRTIPPRYTASAEVQLNALKSPQEAGFKVDESYVQAYVTTQAELIRDPQVAERAVDDLGWAASPEFADAYAARGAGDSRSLRRWLADGLIGAVRVSLKPESNILEIKYISGSPDQARAGADTVRKAYLEVVADSARENAQRNSAWYSDEAEKMGLTLRNLELEKARYERETGVMLQDSHQDIDSAKLSALSGHVEAPLIGSAPATPLAVGQQLAGIDQEIARLQVSLGPQHPVLQGLRQRRAVIAAEAGRAAAPVIGPSAGQSHETTLNAQRSKVESERTALNSLKTLQDEIDVLRERLEGAMARTAGLQQVGEAGQRELIPLDSPQLPDHADFPNKPLIMGGAGLLGLACGIMLAILLELLERRVRSVFDLRALEGAPVIGTVPYLRGRRARPSRSKRPSGGLRLPRGARAPAAAAAESV